jgi:hypothetical protein
MIMAATEMAMPPTEIPEMMLMTFVDFLEKR